MNAYTIRGVGRMAGFSHIGYFCFPATHWRALLKMPTALFAATLGFAAASQAGAAEVTVLSGGAAKSGFTGAAAAWEKKSGNRVKAEFAPAGEMRKKVAAGEVTDILIVPSENLAEYEKGGAVDMATRRDIAAVAMGVAVRQGAPSPDISTTEAFKRALVETKSLTYMDPTRGTSGKHFDEAVLPKLGIRDQVRAKAQLGQGGYIADKVAKGEVDMAIHQMTEMLPVPGVTVVGPLPAELQKVTVYSGVVMKGAKNRAAAQALLDFLSSAEGRKHFIERGYTAP
jgi:molybdate transport system substrate-binding protein